MTDPVVIDSCVVGPMLLWDEAENLLEGLSDCFESDRVVVPAHWPIEVASMMMNAVKRKRLDRTDADRALRSFSRLPVTIDSADPQRAWSHVTRLAWHHKLTVYDAAYLELALRIGALLATDDDELRSAAMRERVRLLS